MAKVSPLVVMMKIDFIINSQAAMSITQQKLVHDLENLLNSFIQAIATAIGGKIKIHPRAYQSGFPNSFRYSQRAINEDNEGIYKDSF